MPVSHFNICPIGVIVPVGAPVSNCKTFKIGFKDVCVFSIRNVVLVDLPSQVGHINASIRLSAYVKFVLLELWELVEEGKDGSQVVFSRFIVSERTFLDAIAV